jgi:hypothetical protein
MPDKLSEEEISIDIDEAESCAVLTFRPTTDIDLSTSFIGKDDTRRAEYIRLEVHFAPCVGKVLDEGGIELVRTRGVGEWAIGR